MKKNPNLLWIITIALGWSFDFLFWKQTPGINFAIFTVLCLAGGFFILWKDEKHASRGTLWLIPLILFFASVTFLRAEPMTVFLSVLFTLFLLGVTAITFLGGRWIWYSLADYVTGFLKLIASMVARPLSFSAEVKREQVESGTTVKKFNLWAIIRGIVIALPVVAIFAALLSSADVVFGNQLDALIKLFKLENLPEYIFRLVYILVGAYLLAGVFLHAASASKDEKLIGEDKPLANRFLGFTETAIVLGSVNVLFTAFVMVQFRYFFGGQTYLGVGGLTDSEYARRGFGELATVAFLSLLMIMGLSTITRRENETQRRAYSILSVILVALVMVILVSAFQRLLLNELAHGFFRLRTYSHVFYIWLALLLVAVVVLEILHRERAFASAVIVASMGFVLSLSLLNVDAFTTRQAILRAIEGKYFNVADLSSLSTDSVPVLVEEFLSPSTPNSVREEIGAVLLCRPDLSINSSVEEDWRSFNLSRWMAYQAVKKALPQLSEYHFSYSSRRVRTPSNSVYECY